MSRPRLFLVPTSGLTSYFHPAGEEPKRPKEGKGVKAGTREMVFFFLISLRNVTVRFSKLRFTPFL